MSHNNPLPLRAALTLGAATLALCIAAGPSLAAGHEGHAAGIAAARNGGADAAGARAFNERMNSVRVETLSPAGFVARAPLGNNRQPSVVAAPQRVQDPVRPVVTPAPEGPSVVAAPQRVEDPVRPVVTPAPEGPSVVAAPQRVQDPVRPVVTPAPERPSLVAAPPQRVQDPVRPVVTPAPEGPSVVAAPRQSPEPPVQPPEQW
jgi:hypothetical protein